MVDHRGRYPGISPQIVSDAGCVNGPYGTPRFEPGWRVVGKIIMQWPSAVSEDPGYHLISSSLAMESRGAMLASTGSQGTGIDRKQPVMRRMELFSWESTWCVKLDRAHTGQQYSATE